MSTRIGLTFRRLPDLELLHRGIFHIRLFCTVQFETPAKEAFIQPAIVDTGAPLCLIPSDLWARVRTQQFETTQIGGLLARKECAVPARVGILRMTLLDPEGHRQRLSVRAFLAESTDVPLILGFQDCLEKASLHMNFPRNAAWLEFG